MLGSYSFSKKVAARYLWTRRAEAFITIITVISILGVAIGVMVLNITMAVMTGFEKELKNKITSTNSHIVVRALGGKLESWKELSSRIQGIPGVESVSAFTQNQALIRTRDHSSGIIIRGLQKGSAAAKQVAGYEVQGDSVDRLFDPPSFIVSDADGNESDVKLPGIIVGQELARTMGLYENMAISVLTPQVSSTPFGLVPRFRRFVIAGVYNSGLVEYESGLAYASLEEAQKFFGFGDGVSGLEVRVKDINKSPEVTQAITLGAGGISSGIYAQDWTETNKPLWDALKLEKKVYFIVLLLIVVMASFSIITTLIMLVLEKRKDIAIMKTLGATAQKVGAIFFIHGATIGAFGTVLGLIAGYLGCVALREYGFPLDERIFQMSTVPIYMDIWNFIMVGVCAFAICCLATIYPAFRASRLDPSAVLRYE